MGQEYAAGRQELPVEKAGERGSFPAPGPVPVNAQRLTRFANNAFVLIAFTCLSWPTPPFRDRPMPSPRPLLFRLATPGLLLAALLTSPALPAAAAIYKCQAPDGQTAYQQTPCPAGGAPTDIRSLQPNPAEQNAAEQRSQRDQAAARELEREQGKRQQASAQEAERRSKAQREAAARCEGYLTDAHKLTHRSRTRSKAHDRLRDEHDAESLRNRHFSECFASR